MIRTALARAAMAAALVAGVASFFAAPAAADTARRVEVGILACKGADSVSFIVGSHRVLDCTFKSRTGKVSAYHGLIRRWGLDVGVTGSNMLFWTVFAPTRAISPSDLDGRFVGVSGSIAVVVGGAANVLLGGSNRTIMLQPLSLEGQTGVNLAVGVGSIDLIRQ